MATLIDSNTVLADFDHHFRVFAGPGAGKTYWLVKHISNVIRASKRIPPCAYVACISYTNVAVGEIIKGLNRSAESAELSTIHSFLYKNVVKPYLHLLKDVSGHPLVNHAVVDGHDEHRPTFSAVKAWLESIGPKFPNCLYKNQHEIFDYLKSLSWQRDDADGQWFLRPLRWVRPVKYLPTTKLDSYKSYYWCDGIIDHDDVLYFAYRILDEYPTVREFLSARFPYLFIDEFQDTNPVQTQFVKWIAEHHTLVGVIGDIEQSIYGFQGAQPEDFSNFSLPGQVDYVIHDNRRSTDSIIRLLNHVRRDGIEQKGLRQTGGEAVTMYVGNIETIVPQLCAQLFPDDQMVVLSRTNNEASKIRRLASSPGNDLWDQLEKVDPKRCYFLEHLLASGELAKLGHYSLAIGKIIRGIRISKGMLKDPLKLAKSITELECRGLAVSLLHFILSRYAELRASSLSDAYKGISDHLGATIAGLSLMAFKSGKFREFADSVTYGMLVDVLRLPDETRLIRTIHQAKSSEFNNVLVSLRDQKQLEHLLNPGKKKGKPEAEEKRITYVALSRARDNLLISIPELSEDDQQRLEELGIRVVRLDDRP
jgi:DNA helicase-2/ATP-dependent DNA helicase PcrA